MDSSPASVRPDAHVEEIVALLRQHGLPGVPVVDDEGRCVGIVTEADLVLPDDEGDLHLPHYINLFGGTVFVEPKPVARVELREWTRSGTMRAPSFKGLRDDVDPQDCVREEGPCG